MAGFRPRSFAVFSEQRRQRLNANQIGRTDHSDHKGGAVVHEKTYRELLAGELQTDDSLGAVAGRLGLTKKQVIYDEGEDPEPADDAIRRLSTEPGERLWTILNELLKKASKQKYVGAVYHLVVTDPGCIDAVRIKVEEKTRKWTAQDKLVVTDFFDLIDAAVRQRSSSTEGQTPKVQPWTKAKQVDDPVLDDPKLKEDEAATRTSLIDYAINVLVADALTLCSICRFFDVADGVASLAAHRLFPLEKEQAATDEALNPTFQHFLQVVYAIAKRKLHAERPTLIKLRDVAICLTLPRSHVYNALKQSQSDSGFTSLPTADLEVAKLIIARALGRIPGQMPTQVPRNALRERIVKGDEGIVEVTDQLLLEMCRAAIVVEEPPESWTESATFVSDFCLGLAMALHVDYDRNDKSLPPRFLKDINDALELFSGLEVRICVFMTTEHPVEIAQLRTWFPQLNFVRVADTEHTEYTKLKYQVKLFDDKINDHFSAAN